MKPVLTLCSALDILEMLTARPDMGASEIAVRLNMDRGKAFRLLATLQERGYVQKNPETRKYSSSIKLFEMGSRVVANMGLKRIAYPFLRKLAELTEEAVNLAIRDGSSMLYIDKIDSTATIRVDLQPGRRMPLYCTGLGKALISDLSESDIRELFRNEAFVAHTEKTIRNVDQLLAEIAVIRQRGYSLDDEEYVEGLLCIAAPVRGYSGKIVAAISVAVPGFRYRGKEERFETIQRHVVDIAGKFSEELSGIISHNSGSQRGEVG